jgi:hypothetical protein
MERESRGTVKVVFGCRFGNNSVNFRFLFELALVKEGDALFRHESVVVTVAIVDPFYFLGHQNPTYS